MHWGHAVSSDLIHWEHQGIALFPTIYADRNGCFSGSALEHDGKMYIYYTGVRYDEEYPYNIHKCPEGEYVSSQLMIISGDGMHFDNFHGKEVVIPPITDPETGDRAHTRDPKVWRGKDAWYMFLGSTVDRKYGEILTYRSDDLLNWTLLNRSFKTEGFGWMWECPDYFETEGGNVLLVSSMGLMKDEYAGIGRENQTICMMADFDEETGALQIGGQYQFMDYGLDLYAPQSTLDAAGRRVLIAWLRMPRPVESGDACEWCGMFCLPRVVEVKNGHAYFDVHPDVKKSYSRKIYSPEEANEAGYRISMELKDGEYVDIGGYRIYREQAQICTDRSEVFPETGKIWTQFTTPEIKDGYHLDIYVENNLVEVYINAGEYVISNAVYGLGKDILTDSAGDMDIRTPGDPCE